MRSDKPGSGGKVWFITGASRGFGALIAEEALAAGDTVVATARDPAGIVARLGTRAGLLAVRLDVNHEDQAQEAARRAVEQFGRIDLLVNNAGFGLLGAVEEASAEEVARVYGTNVFGLLAVTRAVLPQMRRQGSGHVINISSIGGYRAGPGFGVYASTKFAVEGLSEALAAELGPLGVHVTVVEPGYFRTDFLDDQSMVRVKAHIADYDVTAGAVRLSATQRNHAQPGDPSRLAKVMMELSRWANPPFRLPLGSDTVAAIEEKNRKVAAELAQWRSTSMSTDFPTP